MEAMVWWNVAGGKFKKTKWKPRTRKLTRVFGPYFGRNTFRGTVGVIYLVVRHAWNDSIGKHHPWWEGTHSA